VVMALSESKCHRHGDVWKEATNKNIASGFIPFKPFSLLSNTDRTAAAAAAALRRSCCCWSHPGRPILK